MTKQDVPKKISSDIAIKKQNLDMVDTSVPIKNEDVQITAEKKKKKYNCDDLMKEDICGIDDTGKLRAYIMCYARKTEDMSSGMKEAWGKRRSCETTSKTSRPQ